MAIGDEKLGVPDQHSDNSIEHKESKDAHAQDFGTEQKHPQTVHPAPTNDGGDGSSGYETDLRHMKPGYYRSTFFLGSFMAIGFALLAGVSNFAFIAPLLGVINNDIGPDPNYVWISYIYNAAIAVAFPVVGRLSDIFGRRYFFIGGGVLGLIGAIVAATAKTIPVLIGGNVLLGLSTATQLSYHYVLGELVPTKYRYIATSSVQTAILQRAQLYTYGTQKIHSAWYLLPKLALDIAEDVLRLMTII